MDASVLNEVHGNQIAALTIPTAVMLVTSRGASGADNVASVAWVMPVSHEPSYIAVALRGAGRTASGIVEGGCFTVNVLPAGKDSARIALVCGKKAGVEDRFAQAGITASPGKRASAVRVEQALSWIECELVEHRAYGDHELYIGKTLVAETRGALDADGVLVPEPVLLMGQRGCFGRFEED